MLNPVENLLSSEKMGRDWGGGGLGREGEKKESNAFNRFVFLLQFSWENLSVVIHLFQCFYLSIFCFCSCSESFCLETVMLFVDGERNALEITVT